MKLEELSQDARHRFAAWVEAEKERRAERARRRFISDDELREMAAYLPDRCKLNADGSVTVPFQNLLRDD